MMKKYVAKFQQGRDDFRRWLGIKLFDSKQSAPIDLDNLTHFVFLRLDAKWGDAIVSSFVFSQIRRHFANARITVVSTPQMAALFRDYYEVDNVIEVKKRPNYKQLAKLAAELGKVDVLVHMAEVLKMKDLFLLNKVDAKIIAGVDDQVNLINLKFGNKTSGKHYADKFEELLRDLGIQDQDSQYSIPVDPAAEQSIAALLAQKDNQALVVINAYGSGSARKLGVEKTLFIIDEILSLNAHLNIALLYPPEYKDEVKDICSKYNKNNVFYNEQSKTIFDSISLVKASKIVISVDTSIVHIASGLNKAILAIYNPDKNNFNAWHPRSSRAISIFSEAAKPYRLSNIDNATLKQGIYTIMNNNELVWRLIETS